ncbi:S1C family serine protease [Nocardioides sp.]|uniref:S1C family serine protease n=1 Tax=Nocardioides sp. TaxID=35761 RepID=UPI002B273C05|nr:trypsin-like peptidase domain-containing protein [Nocardioides sp.]
MTSTAPEATAHTTRPARRPLRRAAAAVGVVALAAPFALGVTALGSTASLSAVSAVSAGESLTAEPGVMATADRDDLRPPRGTFRRHPGQLGNDGGGLSAVPDLPGSTGADTYGYTDTVDATAEESAGLALISSTIDYGDGEAAGSGLVLSSDGLVVTNHHVVADATSLEVTLAGATEAGETYEATYVGGDATRDIAVLRLVGASGLTPVSLDDDGVSAGETVTAVGDAGGDGGSLTAAEGTVTDVSTGIDVSNDDGTTSRLRALIEVDADIVPGDSGGALLDADGEVVGMNVAASSGGRNIIGYAIPVSRVLRIADAIVDGDQGAANSDITLGYDAFLGNAPIA